MSTQKKRVVIYARISKDEGQSADSIAYQVEKCKAEIAKHSDWALLTSFGDGGVVADVGYKRDTRNRPGYQSLLAGLPENSQESAAFDVLIFHRLDRLQVRISYLTDFTRVAQKHKVLLVAANGAWNSTMPAADTQAALSSYVGTSEKDAIRERTRDSLWRSAREGRNAGGCPYGYRSVPKDPNYPKDSPKYLELRPDHARVVRRIFRDYAGGTSAAELAWTLNAEKVPSPGARWYERPVPTGKVDRRTRGRDGKWTTTSILSIIDNPAYIGERRYGARENVWLDDQDVAARAVASARQQEKGAAPIKVAVPPILTGPDRKLWDKALARREAQRHKYFKDRRPGRSAKAGRAVILATICAECGRPYTSAGSYPASKKHPDGPRISKLACSGHMSCGTGKSAKAGVPRQAGKKCDNTVRVRADILHARVLGKLRAALTTDPAHRKWAADVAAAAKRRSRKPPAAEVDGLRAALPAAIKERDNLRAHLRKYAPGEDPALEADYERARAEVARIESALADRPGRPVADVTAAIPARMADLARRLDRLMADLPGHPDLAERARAALLDLVGPVRIARAPNGGPVGRFSLSPAVLVRGMECPGQELNLRPAA